MAAAISNLTTLNIITLTQSEYEALENPDQNIFYVVNKI